MTLIRKVTVARAAGDDLEFVLSDDSRDRHGTVIDPKGWVLSNFKNNPICLFNHNGSFPIGTWNNVRVEGKRLLGKLKLAAKGTSDRINELISLVEQDIIRAVSVGFDPIEFDGDLYKKQELLEASLVSVGSNTSALALARSLQISDETIDLVFGKHAGTHGKDTRGSNGEHAAPPPVRKSNTMTPIAQRIEDAQTNYNAAKTELEDHLAGLNDDNVSDEQLARTRQLNATAKSKSDVLESLKEAEQTLASNSVPVVQRSDTAAVTASADTGGIVVSGRRPFAVPAKKVNPLDYFWRAAAIKVVAHRTKVDPNLIRQREYPDDLPTKVITDIVTRSSTAPADTTTSGWASQLVQTINADFMESLTPSAVYPRLSALGLRLSFGRNGIISIPSRLATPTIAGSFVGENAPIPVRQGAFTSITLTPKKMAVISSMSREISEHSVPAIEGLIRDAIQEDTRVAIDTVLLDATAATAIRPAGLRAGVAAIGATGGGGLAALVGDMGALTGALVTNTGGNLRSPVWIMNPQAANAISLLQNSIGLFPFRDEINNNMLNRYPVIVSGTVPTGVVILVDAADFVSVSGDEPRFDISDTATVHMEDTTPLALNSGDTDGVAAPIRSFWQTDSLGIRMIMPMNWALRRTGVIVWTETISWD